MTQRNDLSDNDLLRQMLAGDEDALAQRYAGSVERIDTGIHSRAHEIARLAVPEFEHGRGMAADQALPLYIRVKVALAMHEQP